MSARWIVLVVASIIAAAAPSRGGAATGDEYSLGAGDRLTLKVLEWRPDRGEPYEWPGFTGDYTVGDQGSLAVPIIGFVPAQDKTISEVAQQIGHALQKQAGLANPLQVSLQVSQYRPCYVLGGVEKPGEYPFRPKLTVLEAVSLAGGMYREPDTELTIERQETEAQGRLQSLASEQAGLSAERARLAAESDNLTKIDFPDVADSATERGTVSPISVQRSLFDSRRATLSARLQALDETKKLFGAEIDNLTEKLGVLARQETLSKAELDNVSDLMKKGLAVEPRRMALEQDYDQIQSTKLDAQLSIIRAKQGIATAERDKNDLQNARRSEALALIATVDAKITQNESARTTAMRLADQARTKLKHEGDRLSAQEIAPVYTVRRKGVDQPMIVSETDQLQPGDVLKVGDGRSSKVVN